MNESADGNVITDRDDVAKAQIDAMVAVLRSVVPDHGGVYVSTPITTGVRFVEWRRGSGKGIAPDDPSYRASLRANVIEPNIEAAKPVVERLRAEGRLVIDPTGLDDIDHWKQGHYHELWTRVVHEYADSVVFVSGWDYSVGAIHEMARALANDLDVFEAAQAHLVKLDGSAIRDRINRAIADVRTDGVIDADDLRDSLAAIDRVVGGS